MSLFDVPHLLSTYGYLGIFVVVFLESGIFFFLPGDSLLFTAGIIATTIGLSLFAFIPLVFVATFLGGIVGYFIGVYIEHLHKYALFRKILKKEHIDKAHAFFEERGRVAIILARFLAVVRTFMPIAAGIAEMNFSSFLRYSLVGSFLWSTVVPLSGYFLGREFPQVQNYISYLVVTIVLASIVPVLYDWYQRRKKRAEAR